MYLTLETLAGGPQICYYHYDALGSVTDLSNSSGSHIEHYYYDPFGNTRIYDPATGMRREESIISNPYRFTARRWDSESSLYYYRARMYDPNLGRFLQTDPVGYDAGDMNLYRYCGNNPLNSKDPLGRCDDRTIQELINAFIRAMQKSDYEDAAIAAFLIGKKLEQLLGAKVTFGSEAPFWWGDVTSWIFPGTNYAGWTKSGPGPVLSELDGYAKIHDERLAESGASCLHFWNKDVLSIHHEFGKSWYKDYNRRRADGNHAYPYSSDESGYALH